MNMWKMAMVLAVTSMATAAQAAAPLTLVSGGQAKAQIVLADKPTRMAKLAAAQLQEYIEKISGAKLAIVTAADPKLIAIYVGRSAGTDSLGITDQGLVDGAYRIKTGDNWLVLLGRDTDFVPPEPWARTHPDRARFLAEWDKITGEKWGNPIGLALQRDYSKTMDLWAFDERGSLNAVYALLGEWGVRWYMPGDLGEILPQTQDLRVPPTDRTVKPAFGIRKFHFATFSFNDRPSILWYLRLGLNHHSSEVGPWLIHSHGMAEVHERPEFREAHPDYFAVWGGKRMTAGEGKPCLSSQGLFEHNVRYLRTLFDHYPDLPMGSVFPADGYGSVCECDLCKGKSTPQRGHSGSMSDYVWTYVDRVARELYQSHPDRKLTCFAYGTYQQPPATIERLSPNLVIGIVQPRRMFDRESVRQESLELRRQWLAKSSAGRLLIWDHYPFTAPGRPSHGIPLYFPHGITQDIRSLKGISYGEIIEVMFDLKNNLALHAPIFNHLNLYVTARAYWDPDLDVDALLDRYYREFYGPAAQSMKAFVDFCEPNFQKLTKDPATMTQALTLAEAAQQQAPAGTTYRQRLDELVAYLEPMRSLRDQLAKGRVNVPEARITPLEPGQKVVIDGQLDDDAWKAIAHPYSLVDLLTGQRPTFGTSFKMLWSGDAIYIAIRCEEKSGAAPIIGTTKSHDPALWNGDVVEINIETHSHSYYQLAVNAAGAIVDLDRVSGLNYEWSSQAQVATRVEDGFWTVEMRIPVLDSQAGRLDPLNYIVGDKPTVWQPWHFNVCRQRSRPNGDEMTAFSPTSSVTFHDVMKFAKLYVH